MFKAIIVNKAEDDTIYANLSDVKDLNFLRRMLQ